jgi:hypothetical protein
VTIDTTTWVHIGKSSNADFYEVEPQVLAVVPFDGCSDDETTARESVEMQLDHLRKHKRRAGILVFMDRVMTQTAGARNVYREAPDLAFQACFALVGGTVFGRAVGSIFIGLHPPRVPTRLCADIESALAWARASAGGGI